MKKKLITEILLIINLMCFVSVGAACSDQKDLELLPDSLDYDCPTVPDIRPGE